MTRDKRDFDIEREWESRVLCSDESCIGVIGPDGICKECGLKYEGELPLPTSFGEPSTKRSEPAGESSEIGTEADEAADEDDTDSDGEWAQRKLCSDESCIGVIDPDGRCKECGRPYES